MTTSPARTILRLLAFLAALALPASALAQGGLVLTVTEVDTSGQAQAWWTSPQTPAWTQTDTALRALLDELGMAAIDPGALPDAPVISQVVYGHPHLSATNAINLASLFDASRVLTGEVRFESVAASPMRGWPGVRVHADLHVFATNTTIELLPLDLEEVTWAPTVEEARQLALSRIVERMRVQLERSAALEDVEVGITTDEKVLVITGLRQAEPLIELKQQLKTLTEVDDVIERWAAEGVIAVEINPDRVDDPAVVTMAVDQLLRHEFEDFLVQEISRQPDRIEVMILSRQPGATPPR